MGIFHDIASRIAHSMTALTGDKVLMQAMVSGAANVIVADGEVDNEEIEAALAGMRANPVLEKAYGTLTLEGELFEGIDRARSRAGRAENLHMVAAIADRALEQRNSAFLIAADVADYEGISEIEHTALNEIAAALQVDKAALLAASPAFPRAI
ncbi:Tellurite resistance protein TerB [Methylobacterium sp. BTF04]|uniref:tellurite resistance TerB family protein n=1 Tax=Methylobacterium sp. BTF04 TaxID=2708300 RepID=UPI0013D3E62B|nr:tellurite resistance TerB family protein [Methylobacterium sp. BTF04]NEU13259.1 Tellurite resistance protein TerB [Methylobacterium sp. BTF04]